MHFTHYHFTTNTLRNGQPIPAIGEKLVHKGPLELWNYGLHASKYVWQALEYAPGPMLHRVICGGETLHGDDKIVCRERTIVASIDATDLLYAFARQCALDVIDLWDAPDVVVEYLKTGNEEIRDAARGAARDARDAWVARAARAATWEAARAATWDAARDAQAAAWAARAATQGTTNKKQRSHLTRMVNAAFEVSQ